MKRSIAMFVSFFVCAVLLAGCWSKKELTDLSVVIAVGLDKTKDGRYLVSFQVVNPGNVAGALQRGGGAGGVPISVYTSTGDTLVEASRKAPKKLSRILYYAHTNLVVISEELARQGLNGVFDAIERNQEFRTTTKLVIAHGHSAKEVLSVLTPIDKIPANQIIKTLEFSEMALGQTISTDVWEVIRDFTSSGKNIVLTGVVIKGNTQRGKRQTNVQSSVPDARISLDGLALFKKDRLVRWVNGSTERGVLWGLDRIKQTNITIPWKGKKEAIGYRAMGVTTRLKVELKNGHPSILVHIQTEGDISETYVPINLADYRLLFQLEKAIGRDIEREVRQAIETAQHEKTDVFGFGEAVHRAHPRLWKRIKKEWDDRYFPHLPVTVKVDASIRRTGLRNTPYIK
ncbi:Ger(x)C family spore germination protein [Geobacillus stearothermophilus]|uniref:Ger(x)C family spore germination protein n=1 Tax=Geobacillus stearothermophilus TaxID=1422 RepID=UPI002E246B20|nr:Ger(x)C family spore germination protein [Geobacillus stearothermophilus]MED4986637.1 Ger(x)C family spore germination protein [Geobacillus stearothermophilus]